ncbi:MAG: flavoprotein, partial [Candidatus Thermoplasmatota archaeon]|nr:flavoprotein [Candidatus Thermoplasmatota archaeon]
MIAEMRPSFKYLPHDWRLVKLMAGEYVVAATGASGMPYLIRLLEELKSHGASVHFSVSENGEKIMEHETGKTMADVGKMVARVYDNKDLSPPISSGS